MTTPQRAAQEVAVRAAEMARKTNMRLLGVVENMSYLVGTGETIFGEGGGEALARPRSACRCSAAFRSIPLSARRPTSATLSCFAIPTPSRARRSSPSPRRLVATGRERGIGITKHLPLVSALEGPEIAGPHASTSFERARALGYSEADARTLADHFLDAERRGKSGHGLVARSTGSSRSSTPIRPPGAVRVAREAAYERWEGRGALGYLTLAAICDAQLADPPAGAGSSSPRTASRPACSATGCAGSPTGGLVAALTATSPARLGHPDGGPPLAGTNPLAIGIPSSDGRPLVCDASMGEFTHGDVLTGRATEADLVPFGGEHAHKAFALALGFRLLVDSLAGDGHGARSLARRRPGGRSGARAERARAAGRADLPGDQLSAPGRAARPQLPEHDRVDALGTVDPLLEVLDARPGRQVAGEVAGCVAQPAEPLA